MTIFAQCTQKFETGRRKTITRLYHMGVSLASNLYKIITFATKRSIGASKMEWPGPSL